MTMRSVEEWFRTIRQASDDLVVARLLLTNLIRYEGRPVRSDLEQMVNLFTALRMDQLGKEDRP